MSAPRRANRSSEETRASQLAAALVAKAAGAALAVFLLLGVVAPNLVDLHQDLALAGALLCLAFAGLIGGWAVREILIGRRKIAEAGRRRVFPPHRREHHD